MPPDGVLARFDTLVALDTTNAPARATVIVAGGQAKGLGGVNKGTLTIGSSAIIDRQLEGLRALATGVFIAESGVGNDRTVVNVNTPHDYERAKGLIEWTPESNARSYHDWTNPPHDGR